MHNWFRIQTLWHTKQLLDTLQGTKNLSLVSEKTRTCVTSRLKYLEAGTWKPFAIQNQNCDCAKPLGVCGWTSGGKYHLCLELFWFRVWRNDTSSVEINRHDSPVFPQPLSDPSPARFEISMCTSLNLSRNWVTVVCWISLSGRFFWNLLSLGYWKNSKGTSCKNVCEGFGKLWISRASAIFVLSTQFVEWVQGEP